MQAFHPSSVNTIRITTIQDGKGGYVIHFAIFRIGAGGSPVDNWCSGGLAVRINPDGTLSETGLFEDNAKSPATEHPDTHLPFAGFRIPFYQEAADLVLRAHREECAPMFAIGWDIAITEEGPILVEANAFHEPFQALCGGVRHVIQERLLPLMEKEA